MAQSKSTPSGKSGSAGGSGGRAGGKPAAKATAKATGKPTGKPAVKPAGRSGATSTTRPPAKSATGRSAAAREAAAKASATTGSGKGGGGRPPNRKKPKSIVNQKQTPWGIIATTAAIVVFAIAIVAVVIATRPSDSDSDSASNGGQTVKSSDRYRQPELPAAAAIKGVVYRVQANHTHSDGKIKYDTTPPTGGNHNQYWADCTGTVYSKAIANENAVHMLEHGAIWVTYNANDVKGAQLSKLKSYVAGIDRLALSPYPNLKTPISLQAWGYQLTVSSASDPRIAQFIKVLKNNQKTTPEYGSSCSNPGFKEKPSSFGNPVDPAA